MQREDTGTKTEDWRREVGERREVRQVQVLDKGEK